MVGNELIRRGVQTFGLRVVCLLCARGGRGDPKRAYIRHRPEVDGRLRERACPWCGVKALRSLAWVRGHQEAANTLARLHTDGVRCFRR